MPNNKNNMTNMNLNMTNMNNMNNTFQQQNNQSFLKMSEKQSLIENNSQFLGSPRTIARFINIITETCSIETTSRIYTSNNLVSRVNAEEMTHTEEDSMRLTNLPLDMSHVSDNQRLRTPNLINSQYYVDSRGNATRTSLMNNINERSTTFIKEPSNDYQDIDISTNFETICDNGISVNPSLLSRKDKKKAYQKKRKQLKLEEETQQLAEDHSRVETHPSACSEILQLDREVDSEKNELLEEIQGLKREIDTLKKNVIS